MNDLDPSGTRSSIQIQSHSAEVLLLKERERLTKIENGCATAAIEVASGATFNNVPPPFGGGGP